MRGAYLVVTAISSIWTTGLPRDKLQVDGLGQFVPYVNMRVQQCTIYGMPRRIHVTQICDRFQLLEVHARKSVQLRGEAEAHF